MAFPVLQFGSGLLESVGQAAVLAGTLLLMLMVVAMIGLAYKHFTGDGIEWPEEDEVDEGGVRRGDSDDEWKYY
jgi:hypothetical protein